MPETFKVGDVVQLKSGGPRMTVTAAESHWLASLQFGAIGLWGAIKNKDRFLPML